MNQIQCPNCKGYFVKSASKYQNLYKGIIAGIIGIVLLLIGVSNNIEYRLVSIPFIVYAAIYIFLGITRETDDCTCKNCNYQFTVPS